MNRTCTSLSVLPSWPAAVADLTPIGSEIWLVEGPTINAALGFHYPTRMIVVRLPSGGLWLWSPTAEIIDLSALGPVECLVAPNDLHHMSLPAWHAAHPTAKIYAAPGVAAKQPNLQLHHTLSDTPPVEWANAFECLVFQTKITTEVVFFHHASGALIFTDLLQNMPRDWYRGWRKWVARADLMLEPTPTVPRKFRMSLTNKQTARANLATAQNWPIQQILMAHGTPITTDANRALAKAFNWL